MLKLGLVGAGKQGKRYLETLSRNSRAEIIKVCRKSSTIDYHQVLAAGIDGVIIAADPAINFDVIKEAAFLNIPVLVEKPVGFYLSDIQKLQKLKIPILVNYTNLFHLRYLELKSRLRSPINTIAALNYNNGPFRNFNSLYDYAPHDLSMVADLCHDAFDIKDFSIKNGEDGHLYNIHLKSNQTNIHILCGNGAKEKKRQLAVFCENGDKLVYDDTVKQDDYLEPMDNLVNHFIEVINGETVNPSFNMSIKIHEILYKLGKEYDKKS